MSERHPDKGDCVICCEPESLCICPTSPAKELALHMTLQITDPVTVNRDDLLTLCERAIDTEERLSKERKSTVSLIGLLEQEKRRTASLSAIQTRDEIIEECAKLGDAHVGGVCEDEGNGGVSHDAAARSLAEQIRALKNAAPQGIANTQPSAEEPAQASRPAVAASVEKTSTDFQQASPPSVQTRAGRIPELEATRENAEYWLHAARTKDAENDGGALLCAEQAINAWKNAAYAAHDKLASLSTAAPSVVALTQAQIDDLMTAQGWNYAPNEVRRMVRQMLRASSPSEAPVPSPVSRYTCKSAGMGFNSVKTVADCNGEWVAYGDYEALERLYHQWALPSTAEASNTKDVKAGNVQYKGESASIRPDDLRYGREVV